nr:MAG TPA: hypothetical protein [Caudoviricetes sp.]DAR28671.1 MAG TPA: hypothetical protein [Caudoviricetes sp.]DAW76992.1 MAG TPA: hypothetical protein [Bacteriophage sp.]
MCRDADSRKHRLGAFGNLRKISVVCALFTGGDYPHLFL